MWTGVNECELVCESLIECELVWTGVCWAAARERGCTGGRQLTSHTSIWNGVNHADLVNPPFLVFSFCIIVRNTFSKEYFCYPLLKFHYTERSKGVSLSYCVQYTHSHTEKKTHTPTHTCAHTHTLQVYKDVIICIFSGSTTRMIRLCICILIEDRCVCGLYPKSH